MRDQEEIPGREETIEIGTTETIEIVIGREIATEIEESTDTRDDLTRVPLPPETTEENMIEEEETTNAETDAHPIEGEATITQEGDMIEITLQIAVLKTLCLTT